MVSGPLQLKSKKEKEKALAKILDSSTVHSRVKALKTCLESLVADEMKRYLCENNYAYFYVWYDFYTLHVDPAIKNLGNKALSKDVKDDVDTLLFVIEKLIHLMPEKLASGWHCNSISAFLKRLVTPECCTRYRYVGIRLFLAWFQVVRDKAPADMVFLFSTLVPGLDQTKLTPSDPNRTSRTSLVAPGTLGNLPGGTNQHQQHQVVSVSGSPSGFNSSGSAVDPLVPASQAELAQNTLDQEAIRILEIILHHLIANVTLTCWTDSKGRVEAFRFMLREFRQKFLFKIFQDYNHKMDLYSTTVATPSLSQGANSPHAGSATESTGVTGGISSRKVSDFGDTGGEDQEMRGLSGSGSSSSGLGGLGSNGGIITGEERDLIVQMKVRVIAWIIEILPPTKIQLPVLNPRVLSLQRSYFAHWRRRTITASESDADPKSAAATAKTLPNPLIPGGSGGGVVGGMFGTGKNLLIPSAAAGGSPGDSMSLTSSAHFPPRLLSAAAGRGDHVRDEATLIAYQVFTSNKENVNMCLEILRQALLLPLSQCETTHCVINLVTSWLDCSEEEKPEFVKEEFGGTGSRHGTIGGFGEIGVSGQPGEAEAGTTDSDPFQRVNEGSKSSPVAAAAATHSKSGRCISVVVMDPSPSAQTYAPFSPSIGGPQGGVRAGLDSYLRYLFRALSVVFYIQHKGTSPKMDIALNETRNKVVQVFRKVSLSRDTLTHPLIETEPTWYHAISTLSKATRFLFQNDRHLLKVNEQFLSNLLNTLLVNCLMSNLFVRISTSIWDDLTQLISQVAHKSPVVIDQWIVSLYINLFFALLF
ncbi:ral GTPase-activating protein subunit alpha-1-like isoform X2 [Convolutriloba macropyga]|uniref:ral GTPase-activating protein subunit alpha-1-like isoform X2 n=1 Tax=Convolutriloba macropyga TaxID=536237 RepID=UPI003F5290A6